MPKDDTELMFVGEVPESKVPSMDEKDDMTPFYMEQWKNSRRDPVNEELANYTIQEGGMQAQESPETMSGGSPEQAAPESGAAKPEVKATAPKIDENAMRFIQKGIEGGKPIGELNAEIGGLLTPLVGPDDLFLIDPASAILRNGLNVLYKKAGREAFRKILAGEIKAGAMVNASMIGAGQVWDNDLVASLVGVLGPIGAMAAVSGGKAVLTKGLAAWKETDLDTRQKLMDLAMKYPDSELGQAANIVQGSDAIVAGFKKIVRDPDYAVDITEAGRTARTQRSELKADIDLITAEAEKKGKNVYELLKTEGWKGKEVNPKMALSLKGYAENIKANPFPPVEQEAERVWKFREQANWYKEVPFKEMLDGLSDDDLARFFITLSSTSRQSNPNTNLVKTLNIWKAYREGASIEEAVRGRAGLGEDDLIKMLKNPQASIKTVVDDMTGQETGNIKLHNYLETLRYATQDPEFLKELQRPVIDVRMLQLWRPAKGSGYAVTKQLGPTSHDTEALSDYTVKLTDYIRQKYDPEWRVDQTQAAAWYLSKSQALEKAAAEGGAMGPSADPGSFLEVMKTRVLKYMGEEDPTKPVSEETMRAYIKGQLLPGSPEGAAPESFTLLDHYMKGSALENALVGKDLALLDPKYQGTGIMPGREGLRSEAPNRLHFYITTPGGTAPEKGLALNENQAAAWVRAVAPSPRVYDADANPLGFKTGGDPAKTTEMEKQLREAGYVGLRQGNVTVLYEPTFAAEMKGQRLNMSAATKPGDRNKLLKSVKDPADRDYLSQVWRKQDSGDYQGANELVQAKWDELSINPFIDSTNVEHAVGSYVGSLEPSLKVMVAGHKPAVLGAMAKFLKLHRQMSGYATEAVNVPYREVGGKAVRPPGVPENQAASVVLKFPQDLTETQQQALSETLLANGVVGFSYYSGMRALVMDHVPQWAPSPDEWEAAVDKGVQAIGKLKADALGAEIPEPVVGRFWVKHTVLEGDREYGRAEKAWNTRAKELGIAEPEKYETGGKQRIPESNVRAIENQLFGAISEGSGAKLRESETGFQGGLGLELTEPGDLVYNEKGTRYFFRGWDENGKAIIAKDAVSEPMKKRMSPEELTIQPPSSRKQVKQLMGAMTKNPQVDGVVPIGKGGAPSVQMDETNLARFQEIAGEPTMYGDVRKRGPIVSWSGDTVDKAANINFNYINTPDDMKQAMDAVAQQFPKEIDEARRGVQTWGETRELADALGLSADDLLKRRQGQAFNAETAYAARTMLVNSAGVLVDLAKRAADPTADALTQLEFRKQLNLHYALQAQVSGMTTEAGRALNQFKMVVQESKLDMQYMRDLMSALPDSAGLSTAELATYISKIDNPGGVSKLIHKLRNVTTFDMFMEYWVNALLSGPQTHMVNTLSNTLSALWVLGEKGLATGIGAIAGRNNYGVGAFAHNVYGLVEGFKDGLMAFGRAVKTGEASDLGTKLGAPSFEPAITARNIRALFDDTKLQGMTQTALQQGGPLARAVDLMGTVIRTPGTLLQAEDEIFKSVGYRMHLRGEAYRRASEEGLTGKARSARMQQIMSDPEMYAPDVSQGAINAARYQTFTSELGASGKHAMAILRDNPALRLVVPFVRTPTNIFKFALERTPGLGMLTQRFKEDFAAGGARRDLALAKQALGGMAMATSATMAAEGLITGGGPVNPEEKASLMRQGWQPYSIKVGDKYYAYNRIEPVGMLFGVAADFAEIAGLAGEELQPEIDDLAAAIMLSMAKNATSKTWLMGVSDALDATKDPKRYGGNYVEKMVGTLVPTASAQLERTISPEMEEVNSMIEALKARIPGLSKDLKPKRDLWGEQITRSIVPSEDRTWLRMAFEALNPVYISQSKDSPIDQEMLRLRMHVQRPDDAQSIQGIPVKLTPDEQDRFEVLINKTPLNSTGQTLKVSLSHMVKSDPDYARSNDELKEARIRAKIAEARGLARQRLYDETPELRMVVEELRQEKMESYQ